MRRPAGRPAGRDHAARGRGDPRLPPPRRGGPAARQRGVVRLPPRAGRDVGRATWPSGWASPGSTRPACSSPYAVADLLGFHWTKQHSRALGEVYVVGVDPDAAGTRASARPSPAPGCATSPTAASPRSSSTSSPTTRPAIALYARPGLHPRRPRHPRHVSPRLESRPCTESSSSGWAMSDSPWRPPGPAPPVVGVDVDAGRGSSSCVRAGARSSDPELAAHLPARRPRPDLHDRHLGVRRRRLRRRGDPDQLRPGDRRLRHRHRRAGDPRGRSRPTSTATIVVKSTVPVGFVEDVRERLGTDQVIFSPEFLREGQALHDNLHPTRIVVGEKSDRARQFADMLAEASLEPDVPVLLTDPTRRRGDQALRQHLPRDAVAFFNELDSFAIAHGLSSRDVIEGVGSTRGSGCTTTTRRSGTAATACPRTPGSCSPTTGTCRRT